MSGYDVVVTGDSHVLESGSGAITILGGRYDAEEFALRLRRLNGTERFASCLWALPSGMDYDKAVASGLDAQEYIQAAGRTDQLTVEIRKKGDPDSGFEWVRSVVGHPHADGEPLDVAVVLPASTEMIGASEVFDAQEAADLFSAYYNSGEIPAEYSLRPVEGFTREGASVDLRN